MSREKASLGRKRQKFFLCLKKKRADGEKKSILPELQGNEVGRGEKTCYSSQTPEKKGERVEKGKDSPRPPGKRARTGRKVPPYVLIFFFI
jgi:hypothetical protein